MVSQQLTINPPPSQIPTNDPKAMSAYLSEIYKSVYGIWERTGSHTGNIAINNIDITSKNNIATTDILLQFAVAPNTLNKYLTIEAFGTFATNANNKRLVLYFGNTILLDTTALVINGGAWSINAQIYRQDVTNQVIKSMSFVNNNVTANKVFVVNSTENLNNNLIVKVVATGVVQNDITQKGLIISYI